MAMEALFNATMTTRRATKAKNSIGEEEETFADNLTGVNCRLAQTDAVELEKAGSQAVVSTHKVWFANGLDIVENDEIVIGGNTYEILSVDTDVAGAGNHGAAMLRRVT